MPNQRVVVLLLLLACRREAPPAEASRADVRVGSGSVLIIENRAAIARFLEGEQIPFDDVWTPSANALAFVDGAVIRFLDTHPVQEHEGANVGLSSVRRHLGSYVRECAGVVVAGRQQVICQFIFDTVYRGRTTGDRSFTNINDGGCSVFRVVADVARGDVLSFGCNGAG